MWLLLVLAPVGAEYLLGYDTSTGHPGQLVAGLLILIPLYGAPAVLIRDLARRSGRGWPTILSWCAAWGVVQAGLVDQSMFNPDYRQIEYWDALWAPTELAGVSVFAALTFVLGHVIFSLGAPIALAESVFADLADQPWLSRWSNVLLLILGVTALVLVGADHQQTEPFTASPGQLTSCVIVIVLLVLAPLARRRHHVDRTSPVETSREWPPLALGLAAFIAAIVLMIVAPPTWLGVGLWLTIIPAMALWVWRFGRDRVDQRHRVALSTGALLAISMGGLLIEPLGDVSTTRVIAHHVVLSLLIVGLGVRGWRVANDAHTSSDAMPPAQRWPTSSN